MKFRLNANFTETALVLLILSSASLSGCVGSQDGEEADRVVRVSGAWAVYPIMLVWADEYGRETGVKVDVAGGGAGKGMSDVLNGQVDIAMVSRPIRDEEVEQGAVYFVVTKDAVVGTINSENPVLDEIYARGLSQRDLDDIFMRRVTRWGELVGMNIPDDEIIVYGRADSSGAAEVWALFLGGYTQAEIQDRADANFEGDQPLANAVSRSRNSIGFNNLNYVYDVEAGGFANRIRPIPLDLDGNTVLDGREYFYGSKESFIGNVSAGNYPFPPARDEYLVVTNPVRKEVADFIRWILSDGQAFAVENGYVQLSSEELEKELRYLDDLVGGD
ncbi:MAG TPA: phosphate ABC transporter substrate-binding protein [Candidatus Altiarchaeales archaeon]|nr:phosphate ABC transporter substrate-binding protein [Candidatus Altiarchaeales archaeon]